MLTGWVVYRHPIAAAGERKPRAISGAFSIKASAEQFVEIAKRGGQDCWLAYVVNGEVAPEPAAG